MRLAMSLALAFALAQPLAAGDDPAGTPGPLKLERLALGGDFTLTDHKGGRFQLADLRGKVVLLFFGYTSCTEACPIALTKVRGMQQKLGPQASRVQALFVSLDPARDTAESLRKYLAYFKVGAIGLTGTKAQLDAVARQYEATYEVHKSLSALDYSLKHTTLIFLLDQNGAVRYRFPHTDSSARLAEGVRMLLDTPAQKQAADAAQGRP